MPRPMSRTDTIALRAEACRFALAVYPEGNSDKAVLLDMIQFFERVLMDGSVAIEGIYGAKPAAQLRVIGTING